MGTSGLSRCPIKSAVRRQTAQSLKRSGQKVRTIAPFRLCTARWLVHVALKHLLRTTPKCASAMQEPVGQDGIHTAMVCAWLSRCRFLQNCTKHQYYAQDRHCTSNSRPRDQNCRTSVLCSTSCPQPSHPPSSGAFSSPATGAICQTALRSSTGWPPTRGPRRCF